MAGRLSRVRRPAFLLALLVSAALYAYSLAGIAGTQSDLRSAVKSRESERLAPVSCGSPSHGHDDCPARDDEDRRPVRL